MKSIKKIALLTALLFVSCQTFSQRDTTKINDSLVCIPKSIAKKIAIDLNSLDEKKEENKLLDKRVNLLSAQVSNRDSAYGIVKKQLNLCYAINVNDSLKYSIVNQQLSEQRKKLKWSKTKTTISQLALLAVLIKIAIK